MVLYNITNATPQPMVCNNSLLMSGTLELRVCKLTYVILPHFYSEMLLLYTVGDTAMPL